MWLTDWLTGRSPWRSFIVKEVSSSPSFSSSSLSICLSISMSFSTLSSALPPLPHPLVGSLIFFVTAVTFCCYKILSNATYEYLMFYFISALHGKETELSFALGNNGKIVVWRYSRLALCLNIKTTDKNWLTHGDPRATFCHKTQK